MKELDPFFLILALWTIFWSILLLTWLKKNYRIDHLSLRILTTNILIFVTLISVVFTIGESYYRFFVDTTDSFALNKLSVRWGHRHYKLNNLGARDNVDYHIGALPDKKRVTIIGDSFTAGHGVGSVNHRFANIVRRLNPEFEVHVMAANGMETIDEMELLKKLASEGYDFEQVLLIYCLNDIAYLLPEANQIHNRIYTWNDNLNYFERNSFWINTLSFRFFARRDPDFLNYSNYVLNGYEGETWEEQKKILSHMVNVLEKSDIEFKVVTFPFLHDLKDYQFQPVHVKLDVFWTSIGVQHMDLLPIFKDMQSCDLVVNKYDAHPNERAHALAAFAISDFLNQN